MTLKRHILNCLECASSQGLNSDNTSISVNLSEWISVKTFHQEVKIASDLFNSIQRCIQCNFTLNYHNDSYDPARVSPSIIYIGVKPSSLEGSYVQDVWCQSIDSDIEGVVYSHTSTCDETNIRHFSPNIRRFLLNSAHYYILCSHLHIVLLEGQQALF